MAKNNPSKKKVLTVKTSNSGKSKVVKTIPKNKVKSRRTERSTTLEMPFNQKNLKLMAIGAGLILLGMILMMGGGMPSPDVWDESLIYSWTRITLAPMVIIAGLAVEIYAIFKD